MISNANVAKQISDLMLELFRRVDESVAMVRETCTPEEAAAYQKAAGRVAGPIVRMCWNHSMTSIRRSNLTIGMTESPSVKCPSGAAGAWLSTDRLNQGAADFQTARVTLGSQ